MLLLLVPLACAQSSLRLLQAFFPDKAFVQWPIVNQDAPSFSRVALDDPAFAGMTVGNDPDSASAIHLDEADKTVTAQAHSFAPMFETMAWFHARCDWSPTARFGYLVASGPAALFADSYTLSLSYEHDNITVMHGPLSNTSGSTEICDPCENVTTSLPSEAYLDDMLRFLVHVRNGRDFTIRLMDPISNLVLENVDVQYDLRAYPTFFGYAASHTYCDVQNLTFRHRDAENFTLVAPTPVPTATVPTTASPTAGPTANPTSDTTPPYEVTPEPAAVTVASSTEPGSVRPITAPSTGYVPDNWKEEQQNRRAIGLALAISLPILYVGALALIFCRVRSSRRYGGRSVKLEPQQRPIGPQAAHMSRGTSRERRPYQYDTSDRILEVVRLDDSDESVEEVILCRNEYDSVHSSLGVAEYETLKMRKERL